MDPAEIEAANRLRKTLGLAPLPTSTTPAPAQASTSVKFKEKSSSSDDEPGSTLETRENAGFQNWQDLQDEVAAKQKRKQKALAIKKARDVAQKFSKLEGKGLGDADGEEDLDAKAWLRNSKKREKKIELERRRRLEEELAERERLADVEYGSEDLAGLKVAHEASAFDEIDGEHILTLRDAAIDELEEKDAELENVDLREDEVLKERADLKTKKTYDPMSNEEITGERNLLSQYDEKKRKAFTLGAGLEERDAKRQAVGEVLRAQPISLDYSPEQAQSDYLPEVQIRSRPKRPKTKKIRERAQLEDDNLPASKDADLTNFDQTQTTAPETTNYSQIAPIKNMKGSLKREEFIRQIRVERSATPDELEEPDGIIINHNSQWLASLNVEPQTARTPNRESANLNLRIGDGDTIMEESDNEDQPSVQPQIEQTATQRQDTATGLEEEPNLDGPSLGAALKLLRPRGILQSSGSDPNLHDRQNESFLQKKKRLEIESENRIRLQRLHEREAGGSRLSAAEKQELAMYRNQQQSFADSRNLQKLFSEEYRPEVTIKHVDDTGRELSVKEAFKHLSHKFHGKGSGAGKTAKMLKKIAEEKKRESMTALDMSQATGMNNAMGTTAKKNKQAGVRLG